MAPRALRWLLMIVTMLIPGVASSIPVVSKDSKTKPSPTPTTTVRDHRTDAVVSDTVLRAATTCGWGHPSCNLCVDDAVAQFEALKHHPEVMGIDRGVYQTQVSLTKHWQGIGRFPVGDGRKLVLSRSGPPDLVVASMRTRAAGGKRMRSNRLDPDHHTVDTAPRPSDRITSSMRATTKYSHAGGLQVVGKKVVVPLDADAQRGSPTSTIAFFQLERGVLERLPYEIQRWEGIQRAGAAGMIRLADGRDLVVVGGFDKNRALDFYVTNPAGAARKFARLDHWSTTQDQLRSEGGGDTNWPTDHDKAWQGYQALNLVAQCDGKIFMIGMHLNSWAPGAKEDWADLYRVDIVGSEVTLTKVAKKHLYCVASHSGRACNLAAAGGAYVAPGRELILYATEHEVGGPGFRSIRMAEFRHRDVNHHGTCGPGEGWVELYDDHGFADRSLVFDWVDRDRDRLDKLRAHDGFNDKASSVRWCLPAGCKARLFEHTGYGGKSLTLTSRGSIANLSDKSFGDRISSVRFDGTCG